MLSVGSFFGRGFDSRRLHQFSVLRFTSTIKSQLRDEEVMEFTLAAASGSGADDDSSRGAAEDVLCLGNSLNQFELAPVANDA